MARKRTNRRTVLKGIGAGVIGGIGTSGIAAAHGTHCVIVSDDVISLEDSSFKPGSPGEHRACLDLEQTHGEAAVTFVNNETDPSGVHNVNVSHPSMPRNSLIKSKALRPGDPANERYHLLIREPGFSEGNPSGTLQIEETNKHGNVAGRAETVTVDFTGGSIDLQLHGDPRRSTGMVGTLEVKRGFF